MELLRKLSSKTIMGGGPTVIRPLATEKGTALYHVYGMAHKVRRGEGDNGPWVSLIGRFEAVRQNDGKIFSSPQCFLPAPMDEMLAGQLELTEPVMEKEVDKDGKETGKQVQAVDSEGVGKTKPVNDSVQFGLEIGVKTAETAVGYEYTSIPLVEPGGADPLADLRKQLPKPAAK